MLWKTELIIRWLWLKFLEKPHIDIREYLRIIKLVVNICFFPIYFLEQQNSTNCAKPIIVYYRLIMENIIRLSWTIVYIKIIDGDNWETHVNNVICHEYLIYGHRRRLGNWPTKLVNFYQYIIINKLSINLYTSPMCKSK